ncbi:beta-glucuronosyltransferase GlcAT14A-like [Typha angustifolia]|uniref:beta-glucuronosyltransferase GlcAT14A-like n=1 Tax=Typha angustifolia TaxID=59011 RepID=UPI003C2E3C58
MRLSRFSPWLALVVLISGASILYFSFLGGGIWTSNLEVEVMTRSLQKDHGNPPVFAYWISGSGGESQKMLRLLKAVFHPRNRYLLHLDSGSTADERTKLASAIRSDEVLRVFANVDFMGKAYAVDRTGSSVLAATLHAAAVLLKISADWDWFIALSAADYPIVTQDDLLYAFATVPRDLNFIDHTSDLGWKERERFNKVIIDPSLYKNTSTRIFFATEPRKTPDAFKIFTGSPWMILSRRFTEYCVHGWDNLPRKLLMYFANVAYSMESYFQTVICNSPEFQNTTINNDLRYFIWDNPPGLDPLFLNQSHFEAMTSSGAAFARRFPEDDPVLQMIDESKLRRLQDAVGYGKWCQGQNDISKGGDINAVEPGADGKKLSLFVSELIQKRGCI